MDMPPNELSRIPGGLKENQMVFSLVNMDIVNKNKHVTVLMRGTVTRKAEDPDKVRIHFGGELWDMLPTMLSRTQKPIKFKMMDDTCGPPPNQALPEGWKVGHRVRSLAGRSPNKVTGQYLSLDQNASGTGIVV